MTKANPSTERKYLSVHDRHCCKIHGCKYGDEDCPVVFGKEPGIKCEWCYEDEGKSSTPLDKALNAIATMRNYPDGSYMRCTFCGCKTATHKEDCPIEIMAAALESVPRTEQSLEYAKRNPLGGPAVVFEAMARRIRAGEEFYSVLEDYGFAVKEESARSESGQGTLEGRGSSLAGALADGSPLGSTPEAKAGSAVPAGAAGTPRWREKDPDSGDDLIELWKKRQRHSDEYAAAEIIEQLERELAEARRDRDLHRQAAHEADLRTQAAVRSEKSALSTRSATGERSVAVVFDWFIGLIERVAYGMAAPNPYTPVLIAHCQTAKNELNRLMDAIDRGNKDD